MSSTAVDPGAKHDTESIPKNWSVTQRIAFRFAFCYFSLYNVGTFLDFIPGASFVSDAVLRLWRAVIPWATKNLLSRDLKVLGSADTAFTLARICFVLTVSAIATLLWTLFDARRKDYRRLHTWLRVFLRYTLAFSLFGYGIAKIVPQQFEFPGLQNMIQPLGVLPPMGLLWTFMGYSRVYQIFAGSIEVAASLLLLFRRTATLGALFATLGMANVVALDFGYDVTVKFIALNLLAMAAFLLIPDLGRLASLFVLNRPVSPADLALPIRWQWLRLGRVGVKVLLIGYVLFSATKGAVNFAAQHGEHAPKPPLYGLYEVEEFVRNGEVIAPTTTEAIRWQKVVFDADRPSASSMFIEFMDESSQSFDTHYDPKTSRVTLSTPNDQDRPKDVLVYSQTDTDHVILRGDVRQEPLVIKLRRVDVSKYPLLRREFHWVRFW